MPSIPDQIVALEIRIAELETKSETAIALAVSADERTRLCEEAVTTLAHATASGSVWRGVQLPVFGKKP